MFFKVVSFSFKYLGCSKARCKKKEKTRTFELKANTRLNKNYGRWSHACLWNYSLPKFKYKSICFTSTLSYLVVAVSKHLTWQWISLKNPTPLFKHSSEYKILFKCKTNIRMIIFIYNVQFHLGNTTFYIFLNQW